MANAGGTVYYESSMYDTPRLSKRPESKFRLLPVAFVTCVISSLYLIYMLYHGIPMLQIGVDGDDLISDKRTRGIVELIFFHIFTIMSVICYVRCIVTHPGGIPDDPLWVDSGRSDPLLDPATFVTETKRTGERRQCKWCVGMNGEGVRFKPDRCHHCRLCGMCILKMDHHCPWIYNCVGYANYKFFFLLLCYSVVDLHFIFWTMMESTKVAVEDNTEFQTMFFLLYGHTISAFLVVSLNVFLIFHAGLLWKNMTTIEYCEKSTAKDQDDPDQQGVIGMGWSRYDLGPVYNIKASLGENPLLWLLPLSTPMGDGLHYKTNEDTSMWGRRSRVSSGGYSMDGHSIQNKNLSRRSQRSSDDGSFFRS